MTDLKCPECGAVLRSARPISAGKRVRCPSCDEVFTAKGVAAVTRGRMEEEDDREAYRRPPRGGRGRSRRDDEDDERGERSGRGLLIAGCVGGGVLVIGGAVLAIVLAMNKGKGDTPKPDTPKTDVAKTDTPKPVPVGNDPVAPLTPRVDPPADKPAVGIEPVKKEPADPRGKERDPAPKYHPLVGRWVSEKGDHSWEFHPNGTFAQTRNTFATPFTPKTGPAPLVVKPPPGRIVEGGDSSSGVYHFRSDGILDLVCNDGRSRYLKAAEVYLSAGQLHLVELLTVNTGAVVTEIVPPPSLVFYRREGKTGPLAEADRLGGAPADLRRALAGKWLRNDMVWNFTEDGTLRQLFHKAVPYQVIDGTTLEATDEGKQLRLRVFVAKKHVRLYVSDENGRGLDSPDPISYRLARARDGYDLDEPVTGDASELIVGRWTHGGTALGGKVTEVYERGGRCDVGGGGGGFTFSTPHTYRIRRGNVLETIQHLDTGGRDFASVDGQYQLAFTKGFMRKTPTEAMRRLPTRPNARPMIFKRASSTPTKPKKPPRRPGSPRGFGGVR